MDRLRLSLSRMERLLVQLKAALLNVPSKYRAKPLQRWRRLQSAVRDLERVERQLEAQQQELRLANQRLVESNKQLETVLENIPIMLSAGNEDRVFTWNKEFERVTGYSRHEVVDNPQILDRLFPDPVYRDHVLQRFRELRGYFRDWEVDVCCQDGTVRTILLSSVARDVPIPGWANWSVGVDITRRKQALQRTKLLQELIGELSKAVTPLQVSEVIVDQALKALGAQLGSVALLSEDGQYIVLLNRKGAPADVAQQYQCTPLDYPGPLTEAVRTSIPVWIETREEYVTFYPELVEALAKTGSQATACLPLIVHDRVLGGMGLSFAKPRRFALEDRDLLIALAHYCAQALERAQYHEREQLLAALNERQRLARDLHDAVSQLLFAIKMRAEALMRQHQRTPEMVPIRLEELYHLTSAAQSEMRALLLELQPARLAEADLGELLQQLTHSSCENCRLK